VSSGRIARNARLLAGDPVAALRLACRRALSSRSVEGYLRWRAQHVDRTPESISIVIVGWNSADFLRVALDAVRRFSPPDIEVLVVDNGSSDNSREVAKAAGTRLLKLPFNFGHGPALELGTLRARGHYVVTLDVDAFPIREGWLDELIEPLRNGSIVSGANMQDGYAHPCCLAIRMDDFLARNHTMYASYDLGDLRPWGRELGEWWDVAQSISIKETPNVSLIEATERRGPGAVGTVFGGFVYHNAYSTRHRAEFGEGASEVSIDGAGITAEDSRIAWRSAISDYLGLES
jgi:glycosyltransferase involved in cell wall biosynthesis